ncbi:helix-turn-helix transcriptional regulator [Novosphingopyxis iocasae]|uniref:helix-turn-helix transcriptional regulator n=1 Tax=Novosphingopyxis iocasae TaxID=2762729 RepID=UPI001650E80B|nr:AlpA family phage regulatory protein [Novosphingopyxis iocasae]
MKDLVGLQSRYFVDGFLSGSITSFARPIGGGEAVRMTPTMWELDDCLPRFATGTLNLEHWTDSDAAPTHHIFVDNEQFEKLLMSLPTDDYLSEYQLQCIADPRFALMQRQQNDQSALEPSPASDSRVGPSPAPSPQDRLINLNSVLERCGIKKSKLYDLIKGDQFPKQASVGGRSLWSEREVDHWVEQRKTDRS